MTELIRFFPLEIVSQVWFVDDTRKFRAVEIQSIILVPRDAGTGCNFRSSVPGDFPAMKNNTDDSWK